MITRENIIHFYTKYKENLKTEDQIQENLLKAEDQEAWIENLKNKSRMMRRLYIENEALLNLYIRPFLDGEASLNEELAREFLHQIRMADDEGYEDNLAMLEILELLDGYFQKSDDLDSYIWTLNLLWEIFITVPSVMKMERKEPCILTDCGHFLPDILRLRILT